MSPNQEPGTSAEMLHFNLIVTTTREQAIFIAEHYDLNNIRFIDDIHHLPESGARRGEALLKALDDGAETPTLVILKEDVWIEPLVAGDIKGMASMVWRSIESSVLGHRTEMQRNLLVVARTLTNGCRAGEEKGELKVFARGQRVPSSWKPPRPTKPHVHLTVQKKVVPPTPAKDQSAPRGGEVTAGRVQSIRKGKIRTAAGNALHDDLYLLSKGYYGTISGSAFVIAVRQTIAFHVGGSHEPDLETVCMHLVKAFTAKASRTTWRAFDLIQELAIAGGRGPEEVAITLGRMMQSIPARDGEGKVIFQPTPNSELNALLQSHR